MHDATQLDSQQEGFALYHHYLRAKAYQKESALFLCLEIGLGVILILPFFHVLFPDNFEVQLSKPTFGNQKMKSTRICSSSEKSAWEGFAIFDHFNLHLYLHNALV